MPMKTIWSDETIQTIRILEIDGKILEQFLQLGKHWSSEFEEIDGWILMKWQELLGASLMRALKFNPRF